MWKVAIDYGEPMGHGDTLAEGYTMSEAVNRVPVEAQEEVREHELSRNFVVWYESG